MFKYAKDLLSKWGTLQLGIYFRSGLLTLFAYYDADWVGDLIDKRSITGMVVFLGNSPIT